MTTIQKLTQPTLLVSVLASIKLILQVFGIEIADATLNNFANGICAAATIVGIFLDHGKKLQAPAFVPEQATNTTPPTPPVAP